VSSGIEKFYVWLVYFGLAIEVKIGGVDNGGKGTLLAACFEIYSSAFL
jgi:hypothetical protein